MLFEKRNLPEYYFLKHRHDDTNSHVEYEGNIFNKTLSPYMYNNNDLSDFLGKLDISMSLMFDKINIIKNYKNYIVDKYEYRHNS